MYCSLVKSLPLTLSSSSGNCDFFHGDVKKGGDGIKTAKLNDKLTHNRIKQQ